MTADHIVMNWRIVDQQPTNASGLTFNRLPACEKGHS
jgi:hypothetical protein